MLNKFKLVLNLILNILIYGIANILPKNKGIWIFGAWFGERYSDNPKAFFEYINLQQKHINAIWISKDNAVIEHVKSLGFKAYYEKSLLGIWYQLRAEFAFVCQSMSVDLYPASLGKKTKVVNLWHGLPLKKIMYDVFGDKVIHQNIVGQVFDKLSPYNKIRNDYLLATSEETQNTLSKAFRLPKERTLITGFPRNDVFLQQAIKSKNEPYKCIYMPTFRGGVGAECDLFAQYGFDVQQLDTALQENNIELVLRMHPVNTPPEYITNAIKGSHNITIDTTADIFDSITIYDCMITDYSGGYFDFLLSGKPILFAPFDLEKYKLQERDLYYSYEEVTLKPFSYTWPELIVNIVAMKKEGPSKVYKQSYEKLQERFHNPLRRINMSFSENLFNKIY